MWIIDMTNLNIKNQHSFIENTFTYHKNYRAIEKEIKEIINQLEDIVAMPKADKVLKEEINALD